MSGDRKPWGVFDHAGRLSSRHKTKTAAERAAGPYPLMIVRHIKPGETYTSTVEAARRRAHAPVRYGKSIVPAVMAALLRCK